MSDLHALLTPITIKKTEIPNRAVMPPMGTALAERGGMVSEALLAYMRRMAAGGAGLLISEITAVHPTASVTPNEVGSWDDRFIPGLKKLADAMHSGGSKAALQLHHTGRESFYQIKKGQALAPSAAPSLVYGPGAKEMTPEQIQEIIAAFGAAAARAQEAGFDAVEIHGAHGYLLTQFMSARAAEQDRVMERLERSGVQGDRGPKLNPKKDESYWLNQPGAPKPKLANEKPKGETVDYDDLLKAWREGRVK